MALLRLPILGYDEAVSGIVFAVCAFVVIASLACRMLKFIHQAVRLWSINEFRSYLQKRQISHAAGLVASPPWLPFSHHVAGVVPPEPCANCPERDCTPPGVFPLL